MKNNCTELQQATALTLRKHRQPLCACVPGAILAAFTPRVIRESFQCTGIWPHNHAVIMENANRNTSKGMGSKHSSHLQSPVKQKAFECAMSQQARAIQTMAKYGDSTMMIRTKMPKRSTKKRKNSATALFSTTLGMHERLLEHEKAEKARKSTITQKPKKLKVYRKRKGSDAPRPMKKQKRSSDVVEKDETACMHENCLYRHVSSSKRSDAWLVCSCKKNRLCPQHKANKHDLKRFEEHGCQRQHQ